MKIKLVLTLLILASPLLAQTQQSVDDGPILVQAQAGTGMGAGGKTMVYTRTMGKWWQNSDTARKLQLTDDQTRQLDQIFLEHRMRLADYGAAMQKQDLRLQNLLDADVPDEGQISTQVDQVLAARGKLEREFTMMNLDLRKVLSIDQWKQLKAMRGESGAFGDRIFFKKFVGPGEAPLPPPPPDGL
jgi:Spy/CpxP family protein refolding chaperone